jgi:hypothetical protein
MHGLLTGQESRQQLYTMLTRGRAANHLYLHVVGDGDPHSIIRPETIAPRTPTETLQQIVARDDAPTSATTLLRELSDPAARLHDAVQRYTEGLHIADEQLVGPQIIQMLDGWADQIVRGLTSERSWPTHRADLIGFASETGEHPLLHLQAAASGRDLRTAADMAAVLDWRLPESAPTDPGPLPWLPGTAEALHDHPIWGQYLAKRARLTADLAAHIRRGANEDSTPPVWVTPGSQPSVALIAEVDVWRAANGIDPTDHRPTGAGQLQTAAALWQHRLDRRLAECSDDLSRLDAQAQRAASRDHQHQDQQYVRQPPATRTGSPPAARL